MPGHALCSCPRDCLPGYSCTPEWPNPIPSRIPIYRRCFSAHNCQEPFCDAWMRIFMACSFNPRSKTNHNIKIKHGVMGMILSTQSWPISAYRWIRNAWRWYNPCLPDLSGEGAIVPHYRILWPSPFESQWSRWRHQRRKWPYWQVILNGDIGHIIWVDRIDHPEIYRHIIQYQHGLVGLSTIVYPYSYTCIGKHAIVDRLYIQPGNLTYQPCAGLQDWPVSTPAGWCGWHCNPISLMRRFIP